MALIADTGMWTGKIFTGSWVRTDHTMQSVEPATGDVLGEVGAASAHDLGRCAAAAAQAGRAWAATDYRERAAVLRRAADLFEQHRDEIIEWLTREAGKTAAPAQLDYGLALDELREAAALPSSAWGALLPTTQPGRVSVARRVPFGVVAVIARGTSRWYSRCARWPPPWPPATPCYSNRPRRPRCAAAW